MFFGFSVAATWWKCEDTRNNLWTGTIVGFLKLPYAIKNNHTSARSRWSGAQRWLTPISVCVSLQACRLLSDDYEQVRSAAVQMVWVLSQLYPERQANLASLKLMLDTWRQIKIRLVSFKTTFSFPKSSSESSLCLCCCHGDMKRSDLFTG